MLPPESELDLLPARRFVVPLREACPALRPPLPCMCLSFVCTFHLHFILAKRRARYCDCGTRRYGSIPVCRVRQRPSSAGQVGNYLEVSNINLSLDECRGVREEAAKDRVLPMSVQMFLRLIGLIEEPRGGV